MLRKKLKMLICGLLCTFALFVGGFKITASATNHITYSENQNYDVLIYHTHTHEAYKDTNIVEMGEDLSRKLQDKGLKVKHITKEFDLDYNNAYYYSRDMLKQEIQTNKYKIIIDYHRDATGEGVTDTVNISGNNVSKLMFVETTESPNYGENIKLVNGIKNKLDGFGNNLTKDTWNYRKGITYYSQDLSNKVVLVENGNQNNNELEVKRANTYLASAINQTIENNK